MVLLYHVRFYLNKYREEGYRILIKKSEKEKQKNNKLGRVRVFQEDLIKWYEIYLNIYISFI